jgi:hypothetical protein
MIWNSETLTALLKENIPYLSKDLALSEGVEKLNPDISSKQDKKSDTNIMLQRSCLQRNLQRVILAGP